MAGTVIYTGTVNGTQVSAGTDGWGSGAYAIRLNRGTATETKQIVVTGQALFERGAPSATTALA